MATKNFLIFLHGMLPRPDKKGSCKAVDTLYDTLRTGLQNAEPALADILTGTALIPVHWGHLCPDASRPHTPDSKLTAAQTFVAKRINYERIRKSNDPCELTLPDPTVPGMDNLKESLFVHGLSDAVYYCSADGENVIRTHVYGTVLRHIQKHTQLSDTIRLHVVAHSLGCAIAFDFLFGLFNHAKGYRPDLLGPLEHSADPALRQYAHEAATLQELFGNYRVGATLNSVQLGSFATCGAQLPMLFFRRQHLVERLADGVLLDPGVIGVRRTKSPSPAQWLNFYDHDDLLGYPIRPLFRNAGCLRDIQVNTGGFARSHTGYWTDVDGVLPQLAELIAGNLR